MSFHFEYLTEDTVKMYVEGRLDVSTSPELRKKIAEISEAVTRLVMDFRDVTYVSSAGLRVLLAAHKAMKPKGGLKIRNVNEIVLEVFDVTGFADILTIE